MTCHSSKVSWVPKGISSLISIPHWAPLVLSFVLLFLDSLSQAPWTMEESETWDGSSATKWWFLSLRLIGPHISEPLMLCKRWNLDRWVICFLTAQKSKELSLSLDLRVPPSVTCPFVDQSTQLFFYHLLVLNIMVTNHLDAVYTSTALPGRIYKMSQTKKLRDQTKTAWITLFAEGFRTLRINKGSGREKERVQALECMVVRWRGLNPMSCHVHMSILCCFSFPYFIWL